MTAPTIERGCTVQIMKVPEGCCGSLLFLQTGVVVDIVQHKRGNILVLDNNNIVWQTDVRLVNADWR